ncbi:MAG: MFS transporter [Streptosporangiaceae bacterium]|nr:MFS transporter [Streptosporangiaceae bacterium]
MTDTSQPGGVSARTMILPLALAQFICSYAATNMNVAITSIAKDLHTTVLGLQATITLFTLTMASLMIPGSKLTAIWGRKRCFVAGLLVYGIGALLGAFAPGLGVMILGYSFLEGIGSALLIPPIYILVTVAFTDIRQRARNFGVVSGAGGLGAAAGPLIGGVITSAVGWRWSFIAQVLVVASIVLLSRRIADPGVTGPKPFDIEGAVLCGAGLFFVVLGILQSSKYGWFAARESFSIGGTVVIPKGGVSPVWLFVAVGAAILAWFFGHIWSREKKGREPLLPLRLFRDRTSNLGLGTQTIQWLIMQGTFFVASVFLQEVRGYSAIKTGLVLTPATVGILIASAAAERFAKRHSQPWIIRVGFAVTVIGLVLLVALVREKSPIITFVPGLFLIGIGVGAMLTSSVNVVQSAFPEADQDNISGLSRSVSNLGSSLGTAMAGSIIAAAAVPGNKSFALSIVIILAITLVGLVLALLLSQQQAVSGGRADSTARAAGQRTGRDRSVRRRPARTSPG